VDEARIVGGRERATTGQHLVNHHTQRPQVRTTIQRLAPRMLRAHVGDRAGGAARHRSRAIAHHRDSEVEDLHGPVWRDHDVRRVDIAMHDAAAMRRGEGCRDLPRNVHDVVE
jgi:hypothetical protein